jgi:cell division inhibitor SepF
MILNKLRDFVGITEREDYDEDYEEMEWEQNSAAAAETSNQSIGNNYSNSNRLQEPLNFTTETGMGATTRNNVIGMPGIANSIAEVVVIEPHSFDEMPQVIQTLKERKSVVLNLNVMEPEEAQRAVDFVAGGTYAIDGHQERIGESIFLFTPSCVKVSTLSGTVYDVHEAPKAPSRTAAPAPAWGIAANPMAQ